MMYYINIYMFFFFFYSKTEYSKASVAPLFTPKRVVKEEYPNVYDAANVGRGHTPGKYVVHSCYIMLNINTSIYYVRELLKNLFMCVHICIQSKFAIRPIEIKIISHKSLTSSCKLWKASNLRFSRKYSY